MRIIVTGVSGFLGEKVAKFFLAQGHSVLGISRTQPMGINNKNFMWAEGDLSTSALNIDGKFDYCFHCAALNDSVEISMKEYVQTNVIGIINLLNTLTESECKRIFFFSAMALYQGHLGEVNENSEVKCLSPYCLSKLTAEIILTEQRTYQFTIFRLPSILGVRAKGGWLVNLIQKIRENKLVSVFNPSTYFNNIIHVDDLIKFMDHLILENRGIDQIYVLGAGQSLKISDLVSLIIDDTVSTSSIEFSEGKNSYTINFNRAAEDGYSPKTVEEIVSLQLRG